MPTSKFTAVVGALGVLALTQNALAWGSDGHRMVAAIAIKLLPPEKSDALDQLLRQSKV
jgi:hypothetical protein